MKGQQVLFSKASDEWTTPDDLFAKLNAVFNFTVDIAASATNTKLPRYFSRENPVTADQILDTDIFFCNPPYSNIKGFIEVTRGKKGVFLLPSRTDTVWCHRLVASPVTLVFIKGRLHFSNSVNAAPFPSMLAIQGMPGKSLLCCGEEWGSTFIRVGV